MDDLRNEYLPPPSFSDRNGGGVKTRSATDLILFSKVELRPHLNFNKTVLNTSWYLISVYFHQWAIKLFDVLMVTVVNYLSWNVNSLKSLKNCIIYNKIPISPPQIIIFRKKNTLLICKEIYWNANQLGILRL